MSQTTVNLKASREKLHGETLPYITELRRNDVLLGRGASIDRFVGNIRFRQLVKERKVEYSASMRADDKNRIAHDIIVNVHCSNGRFLRAVDVANNESESRRSTKPWIQVSTKAAMEKVKQALRDCCVQDAVEQNQPPSENSEGVAAAIRRSSTPMGNGEILEDASSVIQTSQWNQRPLRDMSSSTSHEQHPTNVLHPMLLSLMQSSHHRQPSSPRNSLSEVMVSLNTSQLLQRQTNSTNSIMAVPHSQHQDVNRNSSFSLQHTVPLTPEEPTLPTQLAQLQRQLASLAHRHSIPSPHHRQQPSSYIPVSEVEEAAVQHPAMATLDAILLSQPQSNWMDWLIRYIHGFHGNTSSASEPTILSPLPAPPPDNLALSNQLAHLQQQLAVLSHRHPPYSYENALNIPSTVAITPAAVVTNPMSASPWRDIPAIYIHRLIPMMRAPTGPAFTGADLLVLLRTKHQAEAAQDYGCLLQIRQVLESIVLSPHIRRELRLPELQMLCTILQGMLSSV